MNEQVKKVLERVALGVWKEWSTPSTSYSKFQIHRQCIFCCVAPHSEHKDDCPTTIARQELEKG
jgi:hypothetical protein